MYMYRELIWLIKTVVYSIICAELAEFPNGLLNTLNLKHLASVSPRVVYYMNLSAVKPLTAECLQDLFVPTFSDCAQGQLRRQLFTFAEEVSGVNYILKV